LFGLSISSNGVRPWIAKRNTERTKPMKRRYLLIANLLLAAAAIQAAGPKSERSSDAAAFARLKTLAGEWEADTRMGKAHLSYEVIAGGTALVEKETAEKMPAMLTVYHLDGDRLVLTHYCMAGNQPRMQAKAFNPESGEVEFQFLDATNLTGPGAGHMHNATFRVVDNNHLATAWDFYEDGQKKFTETAQYTRVR
jgi:hypothetical protein